jgi:hypothetical protein
MPVAAALPEIAERCAFRPRRKRARGIIAPPRKRRVSSTRAPMQRAAGNAHKAFYGARRRLRRHCRIAAGKDAPAPCRQQARRGMVQASCREARCAQAFAQMRCTMRMSPRRVCRRIKAWLRSIYRRFNAA